MRKPKHGSQPCPNPPCSHDRLMHRGNMSAISTSLTQSGKRRIFRCSACEKPFAETRDPVFFDLRTSEEKIIMALKMLLVKVALADIGFVLGGTAGTVWAWLRRAAQKAEEIKAQLLRELPVPQVQLDELGNFIRRTHAQQAGPDGASPELSEDGRQWVWISFAPACRLILAAFGGPRTFASAWQLIQRTAAVGLGVPCFCSDGFSSYLSALLEVSHTLKTFARTGKPGRPTQPVKEPHPEWVYGQGSKTTHKGRLQALVSRICCGSQRLEALGLSISPSVLARLNLTLRHALAEGSKYWNASIHWRLSRKDKLQLTLSNIPRPVLIRVGESPRTSTSRRLEVDRDEARSGLLNPAIWLPAES